MYEKIERVYAERLFLQEPILKKGDIQLDYILSYIPENKESFILDAGCGNGNYSLKLVKKGYKNIYAVDLFDNIEADGFRYAKASIDNLPFENVFFDFIYSNSVVYYLKNPENGIVEFKRVSKKDAILVFTAHTKYSLFTLWRAIKRDILKLKSMEHLHGVTFYSANYYKNILEKNGFEILLQDGYQASFFIYPFYKKILRGFEKYFKISLPLIKPYKNSGFIGKIKSEISYHSVFVARKKDD